MAGQRILVLLRGLVREQRHWGSFPDVLRSHLPADKIILFDFAGNGQRNKERSATTIADMVDDVRSYVLRRSEGQPVFIVALSLGAMVAVEWMNRYPQDCAGAVLISTSLRGLNPFYQRLLPVNYLTVLKSLVITESTRQKEIRVLKLVSNIVANDVSRSETVIDHWVDYAKQNPVSGINGFRQLIAAMRFSVPTSRPEMPMMVLASKADHMVSPECSATLAKYWDLPLETHDTAGHDIPLDDGRWVAEKIVNWLKKL